MKNIQFLIPDNSSQKEIITSIITLANEKYNFVEYHFDNGDGDHYDVIAYSKESFTLTEAHDAFNKKGCTECGEEGHVAFDCDN